jgi:hypothetical protein
MKKLKLKIILGLTVIGIILGVIAFLICKILLIITILFWAMFCIQALIDPGYFISRLHKDMED